MIGSNVSTVGGILNAFKQAIRWKCKCFQIYITNSRKWEVEFPEDQLVNNFRDTLKSSPVKEVVAHIPFLVNLASDNQETIEKSKRRIAQELDVAKKFGINKLVLHPGSAQDKSVENGIEAIIDGLNFGFRNSKNNTAKILLETMSGQGTQIGKTFEELQFIISGSIYSERIGVCFDTCHVHASGYNLRYYSGINEIIEKFDNIIGLKKLMAFHLNDSMFEYESYKDRHVSIGKGHIGLQAFHYIVSNDNFKHIPKIVENPNRDKDSLTDLKILQAMEKSTKPIMEIELPKVIKQASLFNL